MSDYEDYSWRVALGDTETELPLPDLNYITDVDSNSTFDVTVCGNLTEDYQTVIKMSMSMVIKITILMFL